MAAVICSKCGAEFDSPARFCRRCGNSLAAGEPSASSSEAATRSFEQSPGQYPSEPTRTEPANQWPTAPAYLGPDQMGVAPQYQGYPALATQGLPQKHSKAPFIVLGVVGCILVAVLAMFALIVGQLGHRNFDRQAASYGQNSPPDGSGPSADSGPSHAGHPQIPSPPAPPPPPDLSDSSQGPLASLIYPGSKQTVNVHGDREGTIILSTSDPTSKVVDWYIARLPNANVVNIPFVGGAVVTKGQISVTITPGSPTTVVLAMEKKAR